MKIGTLRNDKLEFEGLISLKTYTHFLFIFMIIPQLLLSLEVDMETKGTH